MLYNRVICVLCVRSSAAVTSAIGEMTSPVTSAIGEMTSSAAAAAARAHNGDGEASDDYFFDEQVNKTTQLT